ncbi:beta-lactamase class D [Neorhizobium huautlense]|uniref:Beta-lactamase class D n=1 Tax=Neorhizobium huautlense TaxID=67774 RepID=A0ABT9PUK9_9HYPH|nr:class D beta-lactamase [Neorhizobium huautlense]MDP9838150.1 beta-lactamase class D [Neorhizobium huautlense]
MTIFRRSCLAAMSLGIVVALSPISSASATEKVECTLIIDAKTGETILRKGTCDQGFYPQSTFKLPLAMMGYDAGILTSSTAPLWPYKAEYKRSKREQKDTMPQIWLSDSIVWYSQEITRKLGKKAFGDYVRGFGYGNMDVSGGPGGTDGLTESWLSSSLKISPDEQVAFLKRFLDGKLPISAEAVEKTKNAAPTFKGNADWHIVGKTGSGSMRNSAGKWDPNRPIGWFVGWGHGQTRSVIFARLLVDTKRHTDKPISFTVRDSMIRDLPKIVDKR